LCTVLGALLLAALQAAARQLSGPRPGCSWCSRVSGHEVTGHTADQCQGPRRAEQQRADIDSAHQRDLDRARQEGNEQAAQRQAEKARQAARLRIQQIGTVTTRGHEIHIAGWEFSSVPFGAKAPHSQFFGYRGRPELASGWTVEELHAMSHGGGCHCDVARLARTLR
jgi:hypothetical protein